MKLHSILITVTIGAAVMLPLSTKAHAQLMEQKISVTFSGPVEVPGQVLPAGTYVFEELEDGVVTRILSGDEKHVVAMVFTIPEENKEPAPDAAVLLGPREREGSPQRVESWSFPGRSVGNEFLYPRLHAHHQKEGN